MTFECRGDKVAVKQLLEPADIKHGSKGSSKSTLARVRDYSSISDETHTWNRNIVASSARVLRMRKLYKL